MKNRPFHARLGFAFQGLKEVWRRERSFRAQATVGLLVIVATAILRPGLLWAACVVISVAIVLAFELLNSAIEYIIDELRPTVSPAVKLIKDAAAAAVLVASFGALAVGALMLIDWL